jgi:hypothetical protein
MISKRMAHEPEYTGLLQVEAEDELLAKSLLVSCPIWF